MEKKIIKPTDISVETTSLNFWWSVYGYEDSCWEDIYIWHKDKRGNHIHDATDIITKGFFRSLIKEIEESKNSEYAKEELEDLCSDLNKSIDEILENKEVLYTYSYDSLDDPDFYEVEFEAKRNKQGIKPCYIEIFYPDEKLTTNVVKAAVRQYCRDFLDIPFSNVYIMGKLKKGYARKTFKEEEKRRKKSEEFIKSGGKYKIIMVPEFLKQLYGEEEINSYGSGLKQGRLENGKTILEFEDGSEKTLIERDFEVIK